MVLRQHIGCVSKGHLVRIFRRGEPIGDSCRACGALIFLQDSRNLTAELAYLAGLIDGEGTIGLARRSIGADGRLVGFEPYIKVVNTNKPVIDWCLDHFEGHNRTRAPQKAHYKTLYGWEINGLKAVKALLDRVQQFLIIKAAHAAIIQEYWATGDYRGGSQKGPAARRIPDRIIVLRQELAARLTELNGGPRPWGRKNRFPGSP